MKNIDWYIVTLNMILIVLCLLMTDWNIRKAQKEINILHNRINIILASQAESDTSINKIIESLKEQIKIVKSQSDLLSLEQFSIKTKVMDLDNEMSHISELFNHLLIGVKEEVMLHGGQIKKINNTVDIIYVLISKLQKELFNVSERIKRCCKQSTGCEQGCKTREIHRMDSKRLIQCCPSR